MRFAEEILLLLFDGMERTAFSPLPKISVNKRFRFRVKRHRHPID